MTRELFLLFKNTTLNSFGRKKVLFDSKSGLKNILSYINSFHNSKLKSLISGVLEICIVTGR